MNIGIIGSGEMGRCLASKLVACGHTVSVANSRGPASLQSFAKETGASAATVEEAIRNKNVIIISIPVKNIPHLPGGLFAQLPGDVVVIDTGNYYPNLRDGSIPALEQHGIDTLWVQEQLGRSLVKVFNSILATSIADLARPKGDKSRIAIAVSGDDAAAKKRVFELADAIGFDAFDTGSIAQSWMQQPGSPVYCRDLTLEETRKRMDAIVRAGAEMQDTIMAQRKKDEALMKADYPAYLKSLI